MMGKFGTKGKKGDIGNTGRQGLPGSKGTTVSEIHPYLQTVNVSNRIRYNLLFSLQNRISIFVEICSLIIVIGQI